jgi:iron(III) transport system substrate-binding protein
MKLGMPNMELSSQGTENVKPLRSLFLLVAAAALLPVAVACGGDDDDDSNPAPATGAPATATAAQAVGGTITVYSGRTESLIQPIIDEFKKATGVDVRVKYGDTAELAALINEEGSRSPADVYIGQDAGALGALSAAKLFDVLPSDITGKVPAEYRSTKGEWVGVSGRARVLVYNPEIVTEAQLPASVKDLTSAEWKGRVGWAPTNGSFQSFVTALRKLEGEPGAEKWLKDMKANGAKDFKGNKEIVSAVASGEIAVGLVNHYYLWGFVKDQGDGFKARNHYFAANDPGSLVNVAGAGVLKSSKNKVSANAFISFLLSEQAQKYFSDKTFEYPLANAVSADIKVKALKEINPPNIDLSNLEDLQGTLALLRSTGVLP